MPAQDLVADLIKASQPAQKRSSPAKSAAKAAAAKHAQQAAFTDHLPQAKPAAPAPVKNDTPVKASVEKQPSADKPKVKTGSQDDRPRVDADASPAEASVLAEQALPQPQALLLPITPQISVTTDVMAQADMITASLDDALQAGIDTDAGVQAAIDAAGIAAAAQASNATAPSADSNALSAIGAIAASAQAPVAAEAALPAPVPGDINLAATPISATPAASDNATLDTTALTSGPQNAVSASAQTQAAAAPLAQKQATQTVIQDLAADLSIAGITAETTKADETTTPHIDASTEQSAAPDAAVKKSTTDKDGAAVKADTLPHKADAVPASAPKAELPQHAQVQNSNASNLPPVQAAQPQAHAAAQSVAAQLRAPVALERVPFEIAAATHRGDKEFQIRLDPAELGGIDVTVSVDRHGKVGAHLVVERPETLDQLRRDQQNLERALNNSGLKTDQGAMQFSLRDQNAQNNGQQDAQAQQMRKGIIEIELGELNGWASSPVMASLGQGRGSGIDRRV